jgi:DNA polymerase-3 subunit alpha
LWDKIESIEEAGVERVFDLCVPPDSNFVAGDIVVHNCMGKKNFEEMAKQRSIFVEGAKKTNDIPEAKALEIFALLEKFAGYGFNKSHSAAYAILSYRTAYLKANYPVHFMAGVLAGELGNSEKIAHFINEASAMGIEVMGPDINESRENFTPVGSKIRFGMGAIKGVGEGASQKVIAELEANGAFKDFHDCLSRMGTNLNRRVIECLVKTGAFDFCGVSRGVLFAQIEEVMSSAAERQRDVRAGQHSFLDMLAEPEPEKKRGGGKIVHGSGDSRHSDFSTAERLAFEKELLGFYISGHPLNAYCGLAEQLCSHSEAEVVALPNREVFRLCGVATNIQRKLSKKDNRPWSPFNLATKQGTLAMNMFADAFEAYGTNLAENAPVVLIGNILRNEAESEPRLNVKECYPLETALPNLVQKMTWVVKPDHPQLPGFLRLVREAINASFGSIKCEFAFAFEDEVIALAEAAPSLGWKLTIPKLQELARHPAVVRAIATPSKVEVKDTGRKWKKRS